MVVAIDGPSGVGKSTVARGVASALGLAYLDTGSTYRAATLAVLRAGADPLDPSAVIAVVERADIAYIDGVICLEGETVGNDVRSPEVTATVSAVSAVPEVRHRIVEMQRAWVRGHGDAVVEGRDIGTVVFPDAPVKVYLTARPEVRAARRAGDAEASGRDLEDIVRALVENGFSIDTSVFKFGRYDDLVQFDYNHADSDLIPWPVAADDVCRRDPDGQLFEFPIYCERQPIWTFLTPNRVYRVVAERLNPLPDPDRLREQAASADAPTGPASKGRQAPGRMRKLIDGVTTLLTPQPWKMDFNQCTGRQLIGGLKRAERRYGHLPYELPFVLIGHSKTVTRLNQLSLRPFLRYVAAKRDRYRYGTFADFDLGSFRQRTPDPGHQ